SGGGGRPRVSPCWTTVPARRRHPLRACPDGSRNPGTGCSPCRRWRPGGVTTLTGTAPPAARPCGSGSTGTPPDRRTSLRIADRKFTSHLLSIARVKDWLEQTVGEEMAPGYGWP